MTAVDCSPLSQAAAAVDSKTYILHYQTVIKQGVKQLVHSLRLVSNLLTFLEHERFIYLNNY